MTNRAAIRWCLKGVNNPPVIQYMLLDKNFDYLIYPKEHLVIDLKDDIVQIIDDIEKHSLSDDLKIYYKSINLSYGRHRRDSGRFHRLLKKALQRKKLLIPNGRLAYELKKDQLKLFKNALYLLDVDCKSRGNAYILKLWAIALKATRSRLTAVIKEIWKARFSIQRMNKIHKKNFQEFYSHFL